ncbi:MAG TPA: fumarylacetoacetate hydrolase family protein [Ignavibacteriaceae bacterium]|nr:fumarylacetoacetate hydrolase family protein [Ignavibacteriaceae bacterium]
MKKIKIKNSSKEFTVGKIVCVGRNYAEHAKELGNEVEEKPVIFLKPASAIIYSGGNVMHPSFSNMLHHEVELLLLIGKELKNAYEQEAEEAIIGYGVGLDMTLRDLQNEYRKKGDPWTVSKCFDTSAVVSDFILKEKYNLTLNEEISLTVNGVLKQRDILKDMITRPAQLVKYISSLMTLEEGDLVFTGTPAGVGKVVPGDKIFAEISGIARLECTVV